MMMMENIDTDDNAASYLTTHDWKMLEGSLLFPCWKIFSRVDIFYVRACLTTNAN